MKHYFWRLGEATSPSLECIDSILGVATHCPSCGSGPYAASGHFCETLFSQRLLIGRHVVLSARCPHNSCVRQHCQGATLGFGPVSCSRAAAQWQQFLQSSQRWFGASHKIFVGAFETCKPLEDVLCNAPEKRHTCFTHPPCRSIFSWSPLSCCAQRPMTRETAYTACGYGWKLHAVIYHYLILSTTRGSTHQSRTRQEAQGLSVIVRTGGMDTSQ